MKNDRRLLQSTRSQDLGDQKYHHPLADRGLPCFVYV